MLSRAKSLLNGTPAPIQTSYVRQEPSHPAPLQPMLSTSYDPYPYQKTGASLLHEIFDHGERQNILCASPTGSGKSYLIHYAAKLAEKHRAKIIIAVPLVALAEQLYADLKKVVAKPGIWTGPSQANENSALVCVCTYEVALIQMENDPSWFGQDLLIVDEVHTIASDRGKVVESLLVHPNFRLNCMALSGTIPNARFLAEAMGKNTDRPTFVIGMKKRPIELEFQVDLGYGPFRTLEWNKLREDRLERLPTRATFAQTKTKLTRAVYELKNNGLLPVLVVAFSCNALNRMADALPDMELTSSERWAVEVLFKRLKAHVGEEDYPLFSEMERVALRGIIVYHSQMPKHYLETCGRIAKQGLAKVILATSALSTGINLPVQSILFTGTRMPPKFQTMPSSLFHQVCGRAGRPGVSKKGTVVLCDWESESLATWQELVESTPAKVRGKGVVTIHSVLNSLLRGSIDPKTALCRSPFSTDHDHTAVLEGLEKELEGFHSPLVQQALAFLQLERLASRHRNDYLNCSKWRMGETKLLVADEYPSLRPVECRFVEWGRGNEIVTHEFGTIPLAWVIDSDAPRPKKGVTKETFEAHQKVRDLVAVISEGPTQTTDEVYDVVETFFLLKRKFPNAFSPDFYHILATLNRWGYVKDRIVTRKGRFASKLVGLECPVSFSECYFNNLLPKEDPAAFAAAVSMFLEGSSDDSEPALAPSIGELCEAINLFSPSNRWHSAVLDWCRGSSMKKVVSKHNKPIGTLCKLLQRVEQTLVRLAADIPIAEKAAKMVRRGLPFKQSMHLVD